MIQSVFLTIKINYLFQCTFHTVNMDYTFCINPSMDNMTCLLFDTSTRLVQCNLLKCIEINKLFLVNLSFEVDGGLTLGALISPDNIIYSQSQISCLVTEAEKVRL